MEEETDNGNQRGKNYLLPNHSKLYSSSLCLRAESARKKFESKAYF